MCSNVHGQFLTRSVHPNSIPDYYAVYAVRYKNIATFSDLLFRLNRLLEEIMGEKENKTLIFTETKRRADELVRRMKRDG